ncbi:hypothetical protein AQUCO_01400640v1 [Aquilegia coerulea]|uniref:Uncharacterized protein n=1 Tax=Aquilegia coerulea TaxID=218851 RepID=A0A2G5DXL5_AQUCA|nr:hypothetical protein AQUCO_01400640v1 [Aquilegia coerulea]
MEANLLIVLHTLRGEEEEDVWRKTCDVSHTIVLTILQSIYGRLYVYLSNEFDGLDLNIGYIGDCSSLMSTSFVIS